MCVILGPVLAVIFVAIQSIPFMSDETKVQILLGEEGVRKNLTLEDIGEDSDLRDRIAEDPICSFVILFTFLFITITPLVVIGLKVIEFDYGK